MVGHVQKMSEAERERFGATLRALREAQGWSVDKFATAALKSRSHVANIEAGRKQPTPVLIRRFAELLKVPVAALISENYDLDSDGEQVSA